MRCIYAYTEVSPSRCFSPTRFNVIPVSYIHAHTLDEIGRISDNKKHQLCAIQVAGQSEDFDRSSLVFSLTCVADFTIQCKLFLLRILDKLDY